jgi:hypothetical protein
MSRRLLVIAGLVAGVLGSPAVRPAFAQERAANADATVVVNAPTLRSAALTAVATMPSAATDDAQFAPRPVGLPGRSVMMPSLYASTAMLQALDIHSTLKGLERGAVEGNPMMSGVASNKMAFIAIKSGMAVGTIFAAKQMAKHNKVAAVLTLIGVNSLYAAVVSHNYQVARAGR